MRDNIKYFISWLTSKFNPQDYIIEVGSYQVEGQEGYADLRPFFNNCEYIGVDIRLGRGVDTIQDVHSLGIKSKVANWVLCLDTLEHVKNPISAVNELKRILKDDGILVISSVMDFPIHEHPHDYWRFTPQIFEEFLKDLNFYKIFFQGDPHKPHTVIGIASNKINFNNIDFPENIAGEKLYEKKFHQKDLSFSNLTYRYKLNLTNPESVHSKIISEISKNSKVLEVGCYTGYMTEYLTKVLNCKVTGIEIDEVAGKFAEKFAEKIIIGDVETLDLEKYLNGEKFDYIILADVLEHLKEPEKTVKKLLKFIKNNGLFLISIPNVSHGSLALELLDGRWDYNRIGLLDVTHLRFFTIFNFLDLLERCGLFPVKIDRVKVSPQDTEFKTLWDKYPKEITSYIEKVNPEFRTYQYVIKAIKMNEFGENLLLKEKYKELKEGFLKLEKDFLFLKEKIEVLENKNENLQVENEDLKQNIEILKNEKEKILKENENLQTENEKLKQNIEILKNENINLKFQINEIENSLWWKIVTKYRNLIEKIFPRGSVQRKFYNLSIRGFNFLLKNGPRAFINKFFFYLKRNRSENKKIELPKFSKEFSPLKFEKVENPDVSIIIPVHNNFLYTYNCLKSLNNMKTKIKYEIIVIDDASTDETKRNLKEIKGIKYVRFNENKGFIKACNYGGKIAKGNYIVFLNNDTVVTDNWLNELISLFNDKNFQDVGIVGSKLIFPDGKLQEAGSIIWNDGGGWNFGKFDDPEKPEYNYIREVDYCSGASIAISKKLFDEIGGFDERYVPAYYEDTDLAMEVRKRGYKVLYNPFSILFHYEGASCGKDTSCGIKKYQEINREKFLEKWRQILLKEHYPQGTPLFIAKERNVKGRILIIDHYVPTPDKDSGSLRLFTIIEIIRNLGWKIIFWPDNLARFQPYTENLQRLGVEVYYGNLDFSKEIEKFGKFLDAAYLLRPHIAPQYVKILKEKFPDLKLIYDTVDLHFVREARRARVEKNKEIVKEAKRLKNIELSLANICDKIIILTPEERKILTKLGINDEKLVLIPNIHEVYDVENDFDNRKDLMFIGGFIHPPNEDAMVWFVNEIFPVIKKELKDVKLKIVGSNPTPKIKKLADSSIEVLGYVPDVTPIFKSSKVFISPLRYGAGLKGKIGQSLSFGLPVVTTSIGAEGFINFCKGEDLPFLIADNPEEFAEKVILLYKDKNLWEKMSKTGKDFISKYFSKKAISPEIENLLNFLKK